MATRTYPCADWLNSAERKHFDGCKPWDRNGRVVATEEFRPPKRGEWYLSGAVVQAYRAPQDLTLLFYIVRPTHRAISQTCTVRGEEITL